MDIKTFKEHFYLKYSLVENIGFEFYKNQLVITLNFANWMQETYDQTQPQHIIGNFVFTGVSDIKISQEHFFLSSNEILDLSEEIISKDSNVVDIGFEAPEPEGFIVLSFRAQAVDWEPFFSFFE